MRFLCVPCDEPMRLTGTEGPKDGSLTVLFACPRCSNRVAMLTNPLETQLVRALDVRLGGPGARAGTLEFVRSTLASKREGLEGDQGIAAAEERAMDGQPARPTFEVARSPDAPITWSPEAAHRLERVPSFVRPRVREGIERFARHHGHGCITEEVMDQARQAIGM